MIVNILWFLVVLLRCIEEVSCWFIYYENLVGKLCEV